VVAASICLQVVSVFGSLLPVSSGHTRAARGGGRARCGSGQVAQEERLLGTDGASCLQFRELTADRLALMFVSQASFAQTTSSVAGATPAPRSRNATSCVGMESVTQYTHSTGFGNQTFIMAVHIEVCLSSKRLRCSACVFNR